MVLVILGFFGVWGFFLGLLVVVDDGGHPGVGGGSRWGICASFSWIGS
jgi:hypothetical protein